jgi:hypothetical protein
MVVCGLAVGGIVLYALKFVSALPPEADKE